MANKNQLRILKQGGKVWNAWRHEQLNLRPDLRGANLLGADLIRPDLALANLSAANLYKAKLYEANLYAANLKGANLRGASLIRANLMSADLRGADLRGADLSETHLSQANLSKAHLSGADLGGSHLSQANLSGSHLSQANLWEANLYEADLSRANLSRADLTGATLLRTRLQKATLTSCRIYGISAWDVTLDAETKQHDLIITPFDQPGITVDNLEVAQFVYLLLRNEKIRHVIDTITSKVVLILGRFTPERKAVLDALREALRKRDRLPIIFDFDKPATRDTEETIKTLAGMARYIIADITDAKSIPQELGSIVPDLPSVPVLPILHKGGKPWGMYDHIARFPWVLPLVPYTTRAALIAHVDDLVLAPAEAKVKEMRREK